MAERWTDEDTAKLKEMAERGALDKDIATALGKSTGSVGNRRIRLGIPAGTDARKATITRVVSETPDFTILAPEETDEEPFDDLLERAKDATDRDVRKALYRRFCAAEIVTTKPIAIAFKSDQHLTMHGPCDVRRAFSDAEIVQQTPGLFAMLGGDGVDNHIRHASAMVSKASRPSDEYRLYDGYLRTMGQKILAMISGNHDDWTKDTAGIDMVGILAARHRLHYAPDVVTMTVRLVPEPGAEPTAEYTIKLRHQYRFNSSLNLTHVVKRMYDLDHDPFDVGVVCHNHEAEIGTFNRHGLERWAIRPGSYQVESSWSRRIGFGYSYPTCPTVILFPNERRVECFQDMSRSLETLEAVRKVAA